MRALIVDDSRFVRSCLRGMLEARGIDCEEAGDGQAALEMLHRGARFDLAFVDWNMPVMNGLEMVKRMQAENHRDLKIMMVTTEADNDRIVRSRRRRGRIPYEAIRQPGAGRKTRHAGRR